MRKVALIFGRTHSVKLRRCGRGCAAECRLKQVYFDRVNNSLGVLGTRFESLKSKMLLQDWNNSKPNLVIVWEQLDSVDGFGYLDSCISRCGLILDEVTSRMQTIRLLFANMRYLWLCCDNRLLIKCEVNTLAMSLVLL